VLNVREAPLNNEAPSGAGPCHRPAAIVKAACFDCTPGTTFLPMTTPFFNKGTKGNPYDLGKARQLLKESGVATPMTLKLLFRSNDAVHQPTAIALKEMWGKIGVNLELDPLDRATATQRYRANQFQVYVTAWTNDIPDPSQLAAYELGSRRGVTTAAKSADTPWPGAARDELEKRRQIYYEIQELALRLPAHLALLRPTPSPHQEDEGVRSWPMALDVQERPARSAASALASRALRRSARFPPQALW
jgi:ABC-type transport system substrate-binding protein